MELRRYLSIVRAHWVLACTAFAVTVIATLYLVMPQPWIYEASGSLRVRPSDQIRSYEDKIRAEANLSEPKVPTTYATLIQSDMIVGVAQSTLPDTADTSGLKVDAQVLIDTTIIAVTTTGQDPETVRDMTTAVMSQAEAVVNSEDGTYQLERVDEPDLPGSPVGPNKNLQMILGVLFGATLAIAIALFAEYVRRPVEEYAITDQATGASNELYLRHRLREETARTVRTSEPFTVATLRVEVRTGENDDMAHVPADRDLRRIARGLRLTIPDESILAYLGGGLFAALLPGMARAQIENTVGGWAAAVGALLDWSSQGELGRRLQLRSGVCEFRGTTADGSDDVEKLVSKLIGEMSLDDVALDASTGTSTATPTRRVGNGPKAAAKITDETPAPKATSEERPETPVEAKTKPTPPTEVPAMPPAPARASTKPGNGGNRAAPGNGGGRMPAKKPVRRVTVIPETDDMPASGDPSSNDVPGDPSSTAATGVTAGRAPATKAAGQEKGDAGDPTG